jgi:ATP-dependent RNA helicase DDX54/DBP10
LRSHEATGARMLEEAMLDLTPDDALEMNKKKKMLRWDAKKRKFVKQSLEEMAQSKSGVKKLRTETGIVISKSNKKQVCSSSSRWNNSQ